MCNICGQPDYLRCNCVSAQPFCDQCAEDSRCTSVMDAQCVIYHHDTETPSQLNCLGIENGTSLEDILEVIDDLVCNSLNIPFEPVDTDSIEWEPGGPAGHKPKAHVIISPDAENSLILKENGLYTITDGRVKVDVDDTLDYLENQIEGSSSPSGVNVQVTNVNHKLVVTATIDVDSFVEGLCENETFQECLENSETPITGVDTQSANVTTSGINDHVIQVDVIISEEPDNALVLVSDGLYVPSSPSGVTPAQNGVNNTVTPGFIELGGELIRQTDITLTDDAVINGLNYLYTHSIANNNLYTGDSSLLKLEGGPFSQTDTGEGSVFSTGGQLWLNPSGNVSLRSGIASYSGGYFAAIKSGAGDITNGVISAAAYTMAAADAGDISSLAGIDILGFINPPAPFGGPFTGTLTNLYGILIRDIQDSGEGTVTNKFAIYQSGVNDPSRFFGDVQNAGGVVQFTSDLRVKENVNDYIPGLDVIKAINPKTFNYTYKKDKTITGIIAQELESVLPGAVSKGNFEVPGTDEKFTDFRMVDQNMLFYTMLNAIKELAEKVTQLENR